MLDKPIVQIAKLVSTLEASEDNIARVVEHWLDWFIGGFITEFPVNTSVNYNEAEQRFINGPWVKYIKSLNT